MAERMELNAVSHSHIQRVRTKAWLVVYIPNIFALSLRVTPQFKGAQCTLSNPHSNAAVDLNGDCLAGVLNASGIPSIFIQFRYLFGL